MKAGWQDAPRTMARENWIEVYNVCICTSETFVKLGNSSCVRLVQLKKYLDKLCQAQKQDKMWDEEMQLQPWERVTFQLPTGHCPKVAEVFAFTRREEQGFSCLTLWQQLNCSTCWTRGKFMSPGYWWKGELSISSIFSHPRFVPWLGGCFYLHFYLCLGQVFPSARCVLFFHPTSHAAAGVVFAILQERKSIPSDSLDDHSHSISSVRFWIIINDLYLKARTLKLMSVSTVFTGLHDEHSLSNEFVFLCRKILAFVTAQITASWWATEKVKEGGDGPWQTSLSLPIQSLLCSRYYLIILPFAMRTVNKR